MSLKGYKPYSHEATISFIKEFYKFTNNEINNFDRFRQIRNNSVYQALQVSEEAKECLNFAKVFIDKIKKLI